MFDPAERASELAALSFERLGKEGMPPTPENYALWYAYYSGDVPDLNRAIDLMVKERQPFTATRCEDLFRRFFRFDAEAQAVRVTGERTEAALTRMLDLLAVSGTDAERYGTSLSGFDVILQEPVTVEQLRTLLGEIAAETRVMANQNQIVRAELEETNRQLATVRAHIQTARREALTDSLTAIANRKAFDLALAEAAHEATIHSPLSLLMLDIDHFKLFNDTHGHLVGDHVLKLVARLLSQNVKGRDTPARYGGEEFAIVLPETRLMDAASLAEQIRKIAASRQIVNKVRNEVFGSVTLSIGVAQYRLQEGLREFVHRADQALYTAKRTGRNKVCTEKDIDPQALSGSGKGALSV